MPTLEEWALRFAENCVAVPPVGAGICRVCHGRPQGTWLRCWSCNSIRRQLSRPCDRVVPVSLCRKTTPAGSREPATGLQLYDWLKRYKSDWDPDNRRQFTARLMIILGWFLERHWACLSAGGPIDVMMVVPSTRRTGPHPLHEALKVLDGRPVPVDLLLQRGPGDITHKEASDNGYVPAVDVAGRGVLIVDDTYTSGSHAQSAASALSLAGANVVAIVPIGRLIDPDYGDNRTYWDRQLSATFSFDVCSQTPSPLSHCALAEHQTQPPSGEGPSTT